MEEHACNPPAIDRFRGEYEFLSNFYPAKLCYDGLCYCNAEAAYQAQKCRDPGERPAFSRLYGDEAKHRGRQVTVRPAWEAEKVAVMEGVLAAKFGQNPHLARWLVETGEVPLREGNPWGDKFWGVDQKTREGENHLGRLLMALRARYGREGLPTGSLCPEARFQAPDGLVLTDREITQMETACIVQGSDRTLCQGSRALYRTAGPALLAACKGLGGCAVGAAKLTPGFGLPAAYVIHTVEPVYGREAEALLGQCYTACLDLAWAQNFSEIVFPPLATGRACFPKAKAARLAVEAVRSWLAAHRECGMTVVFSCADQRSYDCVRAALAGKPL